MLQLVHVHDMKDINNSDCGYTPLHLACRKNSIECVEYLCSVPGIDMSIGNLYHQTALHIAARNGSMAMLSLLLSKHEFDLDLIDNIGFTPLHYAASRGSYAMVKFLLDKGTDHTTETNDGVCLQLIGLHLRLLAGVGPRKSWNSALFRYMVYYNKQGNVKLGMVCF